MNKYSKLFLSKIILLYLSVILCTNVHSNTFNYKKINDCLMQLEHNFNAHSQCLKQVQKQLLEIEQEIDYLRGQVQYNEHQLSKINEKQIDIIKKLNSFEEKNFNYLNDINYSNVLSSNNKKNIPTIHNKNDYHVIDYNKSVNLVLEKKEYEQAIKNFQKFILKYPNSIYQSNAHYWLGQLNYRKGNKKDASYHFALVAKKYPKSLKAPDSLLKVGMIMEETGHNDQAKLIYQEVNNLYPDTEASQKSKKRLTNH